MLERLLVSSHGEMTFTRRGASSTVVNIDIGGRGTTWRLVVAIYLPSTVKKLLSAMSLSGLQIGAYGSVVATCLLRAIGLCEWLKERF